MMYFLRSGRLFTLHDDFVLLGEVAVVKTTEQKLSWPIDSSTKKEVGKQQAVVVFIQQVIAMRSHCFVTSFSDFVQIRSRHVAKLVIKESEAVLGDNVFFVFTTANSKQNLR